MSFECGTPVLYARFIERSDEQASAARANA
jgi:hypothetical protein